MNEGRPEEAGRGVSASTFNVRSISLSLRVFFGVTCGRDEMKRFTQFYRKPRKLLVVLSVEKKAYLLAAVTGPGLEYRAALGISCGALHDKNIAMFNPLQVPRVQRTAPSPKWIHVG